MGARGAIDRWLLGRWDRVGGLSAGIVRALRERHRWPWRLIRRISLPRRPGFVLAGSRGQVPAAPSRNDLRDRPPHLGAIGRPERGNLTAPGLDRTTPRLDDRSVPGWRSHDGGPVWPSVSLHDIRAEAAREVRRARSTTKGGRDALA